MANWFLAGSGPDEDGADAKAAYHTLLADLDRSEMVADQSTSDSNWKTIPGSEGNTEVESIENTEDELQVDEAAEFAADQVMEDASSTAVFDAEPQTQAAVRRVLRLPLFGASFQRSSVTRHYLGRVRLNEVVLRPSRHGR
ncbi:hypothetical protein PG985_008526 [Apiospora marii]|uniref:uncharacterized protein n=1 Tax=Apiospora marii TaxID=335849 RepID=UPI00312EC3C5